MMNQLQFLMNFLAIVISRPDSLTGMHISLSDHKLMTSFFDLIMMSTL